MIKQNIAANLAGRLGAFASLYLFVPLYLKFLGPEAYGLVGFYTTLLGALAFADIGLTATLNRETARLSVLDNSASRMRDILRTYELLYTGITAFLAVSIWFLAPVIAAQWLKADTLGTREITLALRLMGLSISLELLSGLYVGGLTGLQRQVLMNGLTVSRGLLRGLGAIAILGLVSPTILAFALWQLASNVVYCIASRQILWNALPTSGVRPKFSLPAMAGTWRYAIAMGTTTLLSALLGQSDKIILSKLIPLGAFGFYSLASSLSVVPRSLANPVGTAVFPRLTGLIASQNVEAVRVLYHRACALVSIAVMPASMTAALFSTALLYAWTGSSAVAASSGLVASLLIVGQAMTAVTVIPNYVALSNGKVRLNVILGACYVVIVIPLLIVFIRKYGVVGAGIASVVASLVTLPPYVYFLHRDFLPGELGKWLSADLLPSLFSSAAVVVMFRLLVPVPESRVPIIAYLAGVWAAATVAAGISTGEARRTMGRLAAALLSRRSKERS